MIVSGRCSAAPVIPADFEKSALKSRQVTVAAYVIATCIVPGVLILILQQAMLIGIGMISGIRNERTAAGGSGSSASPF